LQSTVINTGKAFYFSERIFKFILFYVEHNPLAFFGAGVWLFWAIVLRKQLNFLFLLNTIENCGAVFLHLMCVLV